MKPSIQKEFGAQRPRAILLDDEDDVRRMTARTLAGLGFDTVECGNSRQFVDMWKPGTADVIISDWDLTHEEHQKGNSVLEEVRKQDWDVPFVLVSGRLEQAEARAGVLKSLLDSGSARFVVRGDSGIEE